MYIPAAFHGHRKDYSSNYFTASEQTKKPKVRKIPMDNVHKEGCKKNIYKDFQNLHLYI